MLSLVRCFLPRPLLRHVRLVSSTVPTPRRGRNLNERYRMLERTTGAKSERAAHVSLLPQRPASAAELQPDSPILPRTATTAKTIAGYAVPEQPRAPADDECCMSGCAICVYDLYEEALVAYKDSVATLRTTLSALDIPETQWPAHIRTSTGRGTHTSATPTTMEKSKGAVLSAFEEMERALKVKRVKRAAVEAEKRARGDVLTGDGEQVGLDLRGVYEGIKWIVFPSR